MYEHELEVLQSLRPLRGKHVPALLFHKPWITRSSLLGLQVGEPINEDNLDEQPEEDKLEAENTICKVRELGWEQDNL
jgi:hypothetical protein